MQPMSLCLDIGLQTLLLHHVFQRLLDISDWFPSILDDIQFHFIKYNLSLADIVHIFAIYFTDHLPLEH